MPSILPDYEYDLFISYRHNDNRSGWVTAFVKALQEELAATMKSPLSIYVDINPYDGLLETHSVDKSLEGKLKCLIFIPIISQTYCDPKSFAWQHEFCAFHRMAQEDSFGRDVKLANGNVSSRFLPVKIHDLDSEDKMLLERELGGALRAIEFIYKESGVNRPLTSSDSKQDNQNKTDYRNQVNKVANAVKEIITALKNSKAAPPETPRVSDRRPIPPERSGNQRKKAAFFSLAILLLLLAGYLFLPRAFSSLSENAFLDKSIAVLPFIDLSESKDQGWFSDGLTEEILNSLAHVNGLSVISRTSSFAFKNKNLRIQTIADSLGVNYVVEGSVRKSPNGLRITAQLIRAQDGFHIWSNTYDRATSDILILQQEIAAKIAESLDISLDPKAIKEMHWAGTRNAEAFLAFRKGLHLFFLGHTQKRPELLTYLKKANSDFDESIRLDPDFINPYLYQADFYFHFLVKHPETKYQDTLTDAQAYRLLREGLEKAVEKSTSEIEKDYYRLYSIMYSNDWSGIRPVIERVLKNPEAVHLFSYQPFNLATLLTGLGYGDQISQLSYELLKNDPLNVAGKREIIESMMFSGEYGKAIETLDSLNSFYQDPQLNFNKLFSLYQLNKTDEAFRLLLQLDSGSVFKYHSMKALLLARKGELKEAGKIMKERGLEDYTLEAIEAVSGRAAANREANALDDKLVMHYILLFTYLYSPNKLPFDLSATPNFAKRFKQAGIDIEARQKAFRSTP